MAILGDGVKFAYSTGSPVSWTELTGLVDFPTPPAPVADKLEKTTHGTNGYKSYGLGLRDVPDIAATFHFDASDAGQMAMIAARTAGTELWFRVEVPTNEAATLFIAWEWKGYVNKADVTTPINGWQMLNLGIMYSDSYTFFDTPYASEID